jgi:bacterioferritin
VVETKVDKRLVIQALNLALERELAGMVRYLHHSFIVLGPGRGPLVQLFRSLVQDSMVHATLLGEKIVALGGHPSVKIEEVDEPGEQSLLEMLQEDIAMEEQHIEMYEQNLKDFQKDIVLKLMYEQIILEETTHLEQLQLYVRNNDFN